MCPLLYLIAWMLCLRTLAKIMLQNIIQCVHKKSDVNLDVYSTNTSSSIPRCGVNLMPTFLEEIGLPSVEFQFKLPPDKKLCILEFNWYRFLWIAKMSNILYGRGGGYIYWQGLLLITEQCHYTSVNFLTHIHKRPLGQGMGCLCRSSIWLILFLSSCNYLCNILQYWTAL